MLECVVNVSEGCDTAAVARIAGAAGSALLDVHTDEHHHRSVLTLAGPAVEEATFAVARTAVSLIDIRHHTGAHPRLGAVDVVPFVPLPGTGSTIGDAVAARDRFAARAAEVFGIPCFLYGPERGLPYVRRWAFTDLLPDFGPRTPHPTAGAMCVGARPVLVAYNLWLAEGDRAVARRLARWLRSEDVRAIGVQAARPQVSCNLVAPDRTGPATVYDAVASVARIERAELVGLVPRRVLDAVPQERWAELDLDAGRTIEARLKEAGLNGGRL